MTPTREEFRALMLRAADDCHPDDGDAQQLRALATATDAELLGIVGVVELQHGDLGPWHDRTYIVTPREEGT